MREWTVLVLLLGSCNRAGGHPEPERVPTVTTPTAGQTDETGSTPPVSSSASPPDIKPPGPGMGTYASPACTGRSYERFVTLGPQDAIEVVDRVSPCPPGAQCVWSGIVVRTGTFTLQAPSALGKPTRLLLSFSDAASPKASALPEHLLWWESRGSLTEPDENCSYRKRL